MSARWYLGVCAFALCVPLQLNAQNAIDRVVAGLSTDSAAWQRVLTYVVTALSGELVRAAADPSPQPWRFQLPSDEPQGTLLFTQLRTILRARQPMPSDSVVRSLEIGPLNIQNDTARVEVRFTETRSCPGAERATASAWWTTVLVPRATFEQSRQKPWAAAFSRSTAVGDRLGC